ncbi:MAG: rhamnulokinase, partial [Lachnospiraceae bacterium]|nr:rhamnulokinase [Lachnospiraceae bacterium]
GNAVAYRDKRTEGVEGDVYRVIPEEALYRRTGIQSPSYNTSYQLMALKRTKGEELERARKLLMVPDYFHYLLTGVAANEYTIATTSQLVSPVTKQWDTKLIEALGLNTEIFQEIRQPGSFLGELREEIQAQVGFCCKVVLPAAHDTGSAVMAVPVCMDKGKSGAEPDSEENDAAMPGADSAEKNAAMPRTDNAGETASDTLYISSGTWSLLGTELTGADCSVRSMTHNFTNEGGYGYRFRYLKNIMGLWMIQSVKRELGGGHSFGEICAMAAKAQIDSVVDCNSDRFLNPKSMAGEVQDACRESGQRVPEGLGEVAAVIYRSLAECYAQAIEELEEITGKHYEEIHIVGGGSNADYLNQLTADAAKRKVYAGPTEATAIGNAMAQMLADGVWGNLASARDAVFHSLPMRCFVPQP